MTDKEIGDIISNMVIVVDSREKKNSHIIAFLVDSGIDFKIDKLDTADYSFELPNYSQLGLDRKFLIEKKNSLDEIIGNFTTNRERFKREFERVSDEQQLHIVIENATWKKVLNGSYRSKMHPKSLLASILTWSIRYRVPVWFTTPTETGEMIYSLLKYELMGFLKNNEKEKDDD